MKQIGDSMPSFWRVWEDRNFDIEECKKCGTKVKFFENEKKKPCAGCGTWIYEGYRANKGPEAKINCYVCTDTGVVEYPVQFEGRIYKFVARCTCPKGLKWPGTIPLLTECQDAPEAEFIEKENRKILILKK